MGAVLDPQSAMRMASLVLQMNSVLYFHGKWYARKLGAREFGQPCDNPLDAMEAAL